MMPATGQYRARWTHWAYQAARYYECFCWAENNHPIGEEVKAK